MPQTPEPVRVRDEGPVRWIVLDRPESKNALTLETNERMLAALAEAAASPSLRVVVLTGSGGSFSSGADLRVLAASVGASGADVGAIMRSHFHALIRALRSCPKPVLGLVDGPAVGFGCDLALACDVRIGTERARFGEIFVRRGLMPDGGGTWILPRLLGPSRALELMFTGDVIDAEEALRLGLVGRLVPAAEAEAGCRALADRLARGAPLVQARVKAAVYAALGSDLEAALERELAGQAELLRSKDFGEGVQAFFQKREPVFRGE